MQALEVLLVALGSIVPAETVTVSQTLPTAERQGTAIDAVPVAAAGSVVHRHVTVGPATVHTAPPDTVICGRDGPSKRLEVATSDTCWLSLGPLFRVVRLNVAVPFPAVPDVTAV